MTIGLARAGRAEWAHVSHITGSIAAEHYL